jgi:predicted regulator of Ras-like GTPase activity (Roadblock/LC7/MglB family)
MAICIPLEKVLAQLSRGAVRITFGELRQAAPGVFSPEPDRDKVMVGLPLSEIVPRLNPALIQRRRVQRSIEVPADISSPFDAQGEALVFSVGPTKPSQPATPQLPPARPAAAPEEADRPETEANVPGRLSFSLSPIAPEPATPRPPADRATPPAAPKPPPAPPAISRPQPPPLAVPETPSPEFRVSLPKTPVPIQRAEAPPASPPAKAPMAIKFPTSAEPPVNGRTVTPPAPSAAPLPPPEPAAYNPAPTAGQGAPEPPAADGAQHEPIAIRLSELADAWPEEIRKEILLMNLVEAEVELPYAAIEEALRHGRIAFSWKTLRSWVKPAAPAVASPRDSLVLEMPLKVVAPLFLERQRRLAKPQPKVTVDEDIPNLFFGFPQPESAPRGAGAKPEDTNFYVWDDTSEVARVDATQEKRPTPGTKFVAKYATPNEVVSRAAGLDGVAGALVALPDGLMVASRLAPDMNGDTLAAFLPHIFGKVSQCTKELRMGELNNLNFTVGNVPWKIFRVNAIFFAAFGRAGQPLPTAQLAALAAELDRKPK